MATIFTKIINGEIPCHKIFEDENHLAFLDIQPLAMGHVLCIPKREVDYIFDLSPKETADLWQFTQPIAKAIQAAILCKKVGIAVIGLEVPHAHIHLIPLQNVGDINFSKAKLTPTTEELTEVAEKIRNAIL
jgi:histidine triad (HIT) family protein